MSSFWNFVFGAILIILWIVAGVFITQAEIYLSPSKDKDDNLHRAYTFAFWAAFVTWFLIALFIFLIVLSVVGVVALFGSGAGELEGAELEESRLLQQNNLDLQSEGISWFTIGFLVFALILVSITGVLSAIAATSMTESSNFNNKDQQLQKAYEDCIISAAVCLGAGSVLIIGMITYFTVGYFRESKIQANRQKELAEIELLKQQELRKWLEQQEEFQQKLLSEKQQVLLQEVREQNIPQETIPINMSKPVPKPNVVKQQPRINKPNSTSIKQISNLPKLSPNITSQVPTKKTPYNNRQTPIYVSKNISQQIREQVGKEVGRQISSGLSKYL